MPNLYKLFPHFLYGFFLSSLLIVVVVSPPILYYSGVGVLVEAYIVLIAPLATVIGIFNALVALEK
jgi:hypothetical protein